MGIRIRLKKKFCRDIDNIKKLCLFVVRQLRTQPELGLRASEVRLGRRRRADSLEIGYAGADRQIDRALKLDFGD